MNQEVAPRSPAPALPVISRRRGRLVGRLWRAAEQQVAEIQSRLGDSRSDPAALERDAKTLAVLARTARDLVALEAEAAGQPMKAGADASDAPRDLDAFRTELAQRLDRLRQEGTGAEAS